MKALGYIFIPIFFCSCSVFRSSVDEQREQVQTTEQRAINTRVLEDIEIVLPSQVFADIAGYRLAAPAAGDTSSSTTPTRLADTEPVRIKINRQANTVDSSKTTVELQRESREEVKKETKVKGLFGFSTGLLIAFVLGAIVIFWVLIQAVKISY